MQGYANGAFDAILVTILLLFSGLAAVNLLFRNKRPERRAFILTYAVAILAGGIAQCYSQAVFNNPQSTPDALNIFFPLISARPPFLTLENMPYINSPIAVIAWQQVYKLTWLLGLEFGPHIGVMSNACMMGLVASLTVRTAREFYGEDLRRLNLVGSLFAFNGLFILFGAILIRDCFTTALNVLTLWGIVQWLFRPTLRNLLIATFFVGTSAYAMAYLRVQAILLFGIYALLACLFWFLAKKLDPLRLIVVIFSLVVLLIATPTLYSHANFTEDNQDSWREGYVKQSETASEAGSLGMSILINQPMPIRMLIGSGLLMIYPIPLWAYFNTESTDYAWIKGYNGIYQVLVTPLAISGFVLVVRKFMKNRQEAIPQFFLVVYFLINMAAVVATSLEQRHYAQFIPAFIILAALPDTRVAKVNQLRRTITRWWLFAVFAIHVAWLSLKGIV